MIRTTPIYACPDYADRLVDYSDRELLEEERQMVGEHLASCPGCRAELARLDASLSELNHAIVDGCERSVGLAERAGSARRRRMPRANRWVMLRKTQAPIARARVARAPVAGWAAALVCLGGAVWFSLRMFSEPSDLANRWVMLRTTQAPVVDVVPAPAGTELNAPRGISPQDALWRIAVIEQEARLAASLDLLPRGEAYAAQREQDERLLAKFQSMVRFEEVQ